MQGTTGILCSTDSREWRDALSRVRHDVYHTPTYVELCANQTGAKGAVFLRQSSDSVFLCPMLIRDIETPLGRSLALKDVVSPYGYPGPIGIGSDQFLEESLRNMLNTLETENVVSGFFRLNSLCPTPLEALDAQGILTPRSETVYIDLTASEEEIWRATRSTVRSEINKMKRMGFEATSDGWHALDEFVDMYHATMKRVNAAEFYFFDRKYFDDLKRLCGEMVHLCLVTLEGKTAAAGLFFECDGIVQYHLSGTNESCSNVAPTKLLLHHARFWAKSRGNRLFHLGGGVGSSEDSLFRFKSGFSKLLQRFYTWQVVVSETSYERLRSEWQSESADNKSDSSFFPIYRA